MTCADFLLERVDVVGHEWRAKRCHFIENAAKGPDIAFAIVREIWPYFGAGIVGCACLGAGHTTFTDFGDVEISQFDLLMVLGQEDIGAFDVPVEDIHAMQRLQPVQHLNGKFPNVTFVQRLLSFLVGLDESAEISAIGELSDEEEAACILIVDGFLVGDDVGVGDACEDTHFIEAIRNFSGVRIRNLDLLHGIDKAVFFALHLIDTCKRTLSHLRDDLEIIHISLIKNYRLFIIPLLIPKKIQAYHKGHKEPAATYQWNSLEYRTWIFLTNLSFSTKLKKDWFNIRWQWLTICMSTACNLALLGSVFLQICIASVKGWWSMYFIAWCICGGVWMYCDGWCLFVYS